MKPQTTNEPIIEKIVIAITRAMDANGGKLESYGIPISEWPEFDAAYVRQFGDRFGVKFHRMNLVLRGIPVYPIEVI